MALDQRQDTPRRIDVAQVIERQRMNGFVIRLVVISWIITLFDGFDMLVLSFLAPYVRHDFGIGTVELGQLFRLRHGRCDGRRARLRLARRPDRPPSDDHPVGLRLRPFQHGARLCRIDRGADGAALHQRDRAWRADAARLGAQHRIRARPFPRHGRDGHHDGLHAGRGDCRAIHRMGGAALGLAFSVPAERPRHHAAGRSAALPAA